ncbi:hypothetical protein EDC01DRAFT_636932 [Geopyxis carbonaria]|nr:hypothetical protein EDC01DRAFT_636932 [Geopyxis carbonaria]
MKSFITSSFVLAAVAAVAQAADVKLSVYPNSSLDTGSFGTAVYYANSSLYIGGIQSKSYAEPLILSADDAFTTYTPSSNHVSQISGPTASFAFTSKDSTPTGWQNLLIFPDASEPIGFTSPHSAMVPDGAVMGPFTNTAYPAGIKMLSFDGQSGGFVVVPVDEALEESTYQIYYQGGEAIEGALAVTLTVTT